MISTSFVLGFHGCDEQVARSVIEQQDELLPSNNDYDWLGGGIYFWENSPLRAQQWAGLLVSRKRSGKGSVRQPAVLGAVIELGHCLDLADADYLELLRTHYPIYEKARLDSGLPLPRNVKAGSDDEDLLKRYLDCSFINFYHQVREDKGLKPFDTVRGVFFEGGCLYPGAGIRERTHIQIAVRNPASIKGYFWPREG